MTEVTCNHEATCDFCGREDLPDSADFLEIYAVSLSDTSVRVVEVVR